MIHFCKLNRIISVFIIWALLLGTFDMPSLTDDAFAASSKSITLYASSSSSGFSIYSFDTAFGVDTLVTPASATGYSITWTSSNRNVADVDENGRVLAKAAGTCTITATCTLNGVSKSDSIKVTVKNGIDITGCFHYNSFNGASSDLCSLNSIISDKNDPAGGVQADEAAAEEAPAHESNDSDNIEESLEHDHVEGELLVVFDEDTRNSEIKKIIDINDADTEQITSLGDDRKVALATAEDEDSLQDVMKNLTDDDSVAYVQPNYIYKLDDTENGSVAEYSKDPKYNVQYFHKMLNTKAAWDLLDSKGISQKTIVGVIDSGVDAAHEDLTDNLILNDGKYTRITRRGIEETDSDNLDHGTHICGIIGAVYGNGKGGAGVAAGNSNNCCSILPVGVINDGMYLDSNTVIRGIKYAAESGARVINMSFGSDANDRALGEAIADHYYNGIVFVAAAGNKESPELSADQLSSRSRVECIYFPSDMREVISVCNIDSSGKKHSSSYSGICKDISAPGTDILSTVSASHSSYDTKLGTSMSTPIVSAVAALILDANPDLTPQEVRNIICATASDSKDYCKANEIGYGIIDAEACVKAAYEAREHAQPEDFTFSIKGYYNREPDPYVLRVNSTITKTKSLSRISDFKGTGAKRKIRLAFKRSYVVTDTETVNENKYITDKTGTVITHKKTKSSSAVRYEMKVRYRGQILYYRFYPRKRSNRVFSISVSGDKVRVNIKRFGPTRLKAGKTCRVSIRSYKTINGVTICSRWSKTVKVKVK